MVMESKIVFILLLAASIIAIIIVTPRLIKVVKLNNKYGNGAGLGGMIYLANMLLYSLVILLSVATILYIGWKWL